MEAEVVPVLHVADAAAAVAWYGRLGFTEQWVHRFGLVTGQPPGWCGRLGSGAGGRHRARGKD